MVVGRFHFLRSCLRERRCLAVSARIPTVYSRLRRCRTQFRGDHNCSSRFQSHLRFAYDEGEEAYGADRVGVPGIAAVQEGFQVAAGDAGMRR